LINLVSVALKAEGSKIQLLSFRAQRGICLLPKLAEKTDSSGHIGPRNDKPLLFASSCYTHLFDFFL